MNCSYRISVITRVKIVNSLTILLHVASVQVSSTLLLEWPLCLCYSTRMNKKIKAPSKSFKKRVNRVVESDMFKSIAAASVLLNILFFVCIFVLSSTSTFDHHFFQSARTKYCQNIDGVKSRALELGSDKKALQEWEINCIGKDFRPYFNEAVQKYEAQP